MAPQSTPDWNDDLPNLLVFSKCSFRKLTNTAQETLEWIDFPPDALQFFGKVTYSCLLNGGKDFNRGRERDIFLRLPPGQVFDLDDQCKMAFGPTSLHIGGYEVGHGVCPELKCTNSPYFTKTMDGTTCSNESWCRKGNCEHDSRAPRAPEHCVYGDSVVPHLNRTCKDEINEDPNRCKEESIKDRCCASCAGKRKRNRGCQDTIDECSRLIPRDCYNKYYATTCCKTCRALIQNPWDANCLYGDQGSGCTDLVPEMCNLSTRYCCQTCADLLTPNKRTYKDSCKGDFKGNLDYFTLWDEDLSLTCNELVERNSHLCHYDVVQKYCCASCKNVKVDKGYCKGDDDKEEMTYLYKKFNCRQLVDYNPRLCEINPKVKNKCCKSCGRFMITAKN